MHTYVVLAYKESKYLEECIKSVLNQKYKSNVVIACGMTKLVTIAHQDDIYDYEYSYQIVNKYKKYPTSSIIFSDYYEIRENKNVYSNLNLKIKRILLSPIRINLLSKTRFGKRLVLRFGNAICCPAVTFVTSNIHTQDIFKCNFVCDVDWFAWEKLSKENGKFTSHFYYLCYN